MPTVLLNGMVTQNRSIHYNSNAVKTVCYFCWIWVYPCIKKSTARLAVWVWPWLFPCIKKKVKNDPAEMLIGYSGCFLSAGYYYYLINIFLVYRQVGSWRFFLGLGLSVIGESLGRKDHSLAKSQCNVLQGLAFHKFVCVQMQLFLYVLYDFCDLDGLLPVGRWVSWEPNPRSRRVPQAVPCLHWQSCLLSVLPSGLTLVCCTVPRGNTFLYAFQNAERLCDYL